MGLLKTAPVALESMTDPVSTDRVIDVWRTRKVWMDNHETIATGLERALESLELTPLEAIRIAGCETENHQVICFVSEQVDHLVGCFYFSKSS